MISVAPDAPTSGSDEIKFGYDSQGRRTWKDVYTWDTATSSWDYSYARHYVYGGLDLVGELDAGNVLLTGYTWGPNGQLLAVTDYTQAQPKTYEAVVDAGGNTALLVDPTSGSVAASYLYDSYGNLLSATGPAQALCSILGKSLYYDVEARSIGHALNRDVRLNTWLERDPVGEFAGGVNLYQYLDGNQINNIDRTGFTWTKISWQKVLAEAVQEAHDKFPGKSGKDVVVTHWFTADDTFNDKVEVFYWAKVKYYNDVLDVGVFQPPPPAPEPGNITAREYNASRDAIDAIVEMYQYNVDHGIAPEGSDVALSIMKSNRAADGGLSIPGMVWDGIQARKDVLAGAYIGVSAKLASKSSLPPQPTTTSLVEKNIDVPWVDLGPRTLSNYQARTYYNFEVKTLLVRTVEEMKAAGKTPEEIARTVSPMRGNLKQITRDIMLDRKMEARLPPIQPIDFYIQKYSKELSGDALWNKIIEGALTPNPEVNAKLGAK